MKATTPIKSIPHCTILSRLSALIGLLGLIGCGFFVSGHKDSPAVDPYHPSGLQSLELSPAQDYAGEILAYFLQIVVGHIGSEESRQAWRSTGSDAVLDFKTISKIMSQPASSKADLMVLDFNMLGLVEALSHYNPRFNQFKGQYIFDSVYPSSELVAIRLLIQRKLVQGEKVSFTALQKREALLQPHANSPSPADLEAMNLSAIEFQLVKDVFSSDALFFQYYKHPFIVDAMTRIGFYQKDRLTEEIRQDASYKRYAPRFHYQKSSINSVTVVVLPSFSREFEFGDKYEKPYVYGFKPSANYLQTIEKLKADILTRTAHFFFAELENSGQANAVNETSWKSRWASTYAPLIRFKLFDRRPLTIYPENADRLVMDICPSADLVIFLLGKGIDRAIDVKGRSGDFSSTGRLYFGADDISYYQRNDKIDEIARRIVGRLLSLRISVGTSPADG